MSQGRWAQKDPQRAAGHDTGTTGLQPRGDGLQQPGRTRSFQSGTQPGQALDRGLGGPGAEKPDRPAGLPPADCEVMSSPCFEPLDARPFV